MTDYQRALKFGKRMPWNQGNWSNAPACIPPKCTLRMSDGFVASGTGDTQYEATAQAVHQLIRRYPHLPQSKELMSELHKAVELADELRRDHNGVAGVYLYLGHDGDNVCTLKDSDGKEVGKGGSGKNLLEAIFAADNDRQTRKFWLKNSVADMAKSAIRTNGRSDDVFSTLQFYDAIQRHNYPGEVTLAGCIQLLERECRVVQLREDHYWCLLPGGNSRRTS